ncbi:MAG: CapA family protein [Candidatus Pacebacteria bacterium]|nr:CapA family protein [Candidatus Paceibacterota bacterium]
MEIKKTKKAVWSLAALSVGFLVPMVFFSAMEKPAAEFLAGRVLSGFSNNIAASPVLTPKEPFLLVFVGDIMLDRGVENSVFKNASGDFSFLFEKAGFLKEADVLFGNLEGSVSVSGSDQGSEISFRFSPAVLLALKSAGFDAVSVANNHAADWGKEAFSESVRLLKNFDILPVGGGEDKDDAQRPRIVEYNGTKIGFLGFSDVGPKWLEAGENKEGILNVSDDFSSVIKKASEQADVLVVSFHFGEEYEPAANERQKILSKTAIDSGAKIVIGHHPHVMQEFEDYNGGLIAYSLGNFIFDQNFSDETMSGAALAVYIEGKEITAVKKIGVNIDQTFRPEER